jgi:carboxypeptidase Taq
MPAAPSASYAELCNLVREAGTLGSVQALLAWDQETYMPHAAGPFRAEQQAMIAGLTHERRTSPRMGELLAKCEGDPAVRGNEEAAANVREMRRDYDLATKLPKDLVADSPRPPARSQEPGRRPRQERLPRCSRPGSKR